MRSSRSSRGHEAAARYACLPLVHQRRPAVAARIPGRDTRPCQRGVPERCLGVRGGQWCVYTRQWESFSMSHLLLTGAGFSRNWGGYLANEAFEYLLSVTEHDDDLRSILWRDKQAGFGFEDTLARLQYIYENEWSAQREQDLRNFYSAVQQMFHEMALGFAKTSFEPSLVDQNFGVTNFLAKFDAIFTLNQDTLLETHYINSVDENSFPPGLPGSRYIAAHRPGLAESNDASAYGDANARISLYKPDPSQFVTIPHLQPYFKLHGSIDIKQSSNEMMLILGGDKLTNIAKHPLLTWYHEEFRRHLSSSNSRLMIIGYSFGDTHINQMIFAGVEAGLKIFIVGPEGADAIGSNKSRPLNPGFSIRNAIIGASRRPLLATLSGRDMVENNKINRFFRNV